MSRPADPFARYRQPSAGAVPWPSDNRTSDNRMANSRPGSRSPQIPQPGTLAGNDAAAQGFAPAPTVPLRPEAGGFGESPSGLAAQPTSAHSGGPAVEAASTREANTSRFAPSDPLPVDSASVVPTSSSSSPFIVPTQADSQDAASLLPPGERPQMTNSTRFRLEYDVDAVGPSGVAEVQLWATADGGHTWRLWGTDEDLQSPFDVIVEEEGVFGFHVVVVGRNGMSGRRPRTGDLADIWVGVDTTPPTAELTSATYGDGANTGKLLISWRAADRYLDPRPVTLSFSESADGPWTVITSALPNTREFAWKADPQLPPSVYLRLEVRDEAGNLTVDQTSEPIHIEGMAPKARIRSVQPIDEIDREAFRLPRRG